MRISTYRVPAYLHQANFTFLFDIIFETLRHYVFLSIYLHCIVEFWFALWELFLRQKQIAHPTTQAHIINKLLTAIKTIHVISSPRRLFESGPKITNFKVIFAFQELNIKYACLLWQ